VKEFLKIDQHLMKLWATTEFLFLTQGAETADHIVKIPSKFPGA